MRRFAREVASMLHARDEQLRGPRPATTKAETITEGSLFKRRQRTITHHDDGGQPRFWVIDACRENGLFIAYRPGALAQTTGWLNGHAYLLLTNGDLARAYWRQAPLGSSWVFDQPVPLTAGAMTDCDYADRGDWKKASPLKGEQVRWEFHAWTRLVATHRGGAILFALNALRAGKGIRLGGHATGLSRPWWYPA